jgi:hypothetical protein
MNIADLEMIASGGDPQRAFDLLFDDLCRRLREQGVADYSIEGVQIALMIAYRLGERAFEKAKQ